MYRGPLDVTVTLKVTQGFKTLHNIYTATAYNNVRKVGLCCKS